MDGGPAAPDWAPIDASELASLASRLPAAPAALEAVWHSPRPFSAAARVRGMGGEVFVKRHDPRVRDADSLLEEHRFMAHLRGRGLAVPQVLPLRADDGSSTTALAMDGWTYEVHAVAAGVDLYAQAHSWTPARCQGHARELGRALASLHRAAAGYDALPRRNRPLLAGFQIVGAQDLGCALERYLREEPNVAGFIGRGAAGLPHAGAEAILRVLAPWHAALRPLLPLLEPLWAHNDWHASNAFWTGADESAGVSEIVDFGLCNLGCAMADLATALERNTIAWLEQDSLGEDAATAGDIGRLPLALALLEGYASVRPLGAAEREALPLLMALAHVEYALSEVAYFCGVVGNTRHASLACPGFLLGHVRWFESAHGRAYLAGLRGALRAT